MQTNIKKSDYRFYFKGIFYSTEADFSKATWDYTISEISPVSAEGILKSMCQNIQLNLFHPEKYKNLSNGELEGLCEDVFLCFIEKYREALINNDTNKLCES